MTDRPKPSTDRLSENQQQLEAPALAISGDPANRHVHQAETQRKQDALAFLTDDVFGHNLFPSPQITGESSTANDHHHRAASNLAQGHPEAIELATTTEPNCRGISPARLRAIGASKGMGADVSRITALPDVSQATTSGDAAALKDQLRKAAGIGLQRTDRIDYKLTEKLHAEDWVEPAVKEVLKGAVGQKLTALDSETKTLSGKEAKQHDQLAKKERKGSMSEEDMTFIHMLDKGLKDKLDPDQKAKDFGDWSATRIVAGNLGNKDHAEKSMTDMIKMARGGNPFAREVLAACLVSGTQGQEAWIAAKRGENGGEQRPITVPGLAPELSDKLKVTAAKALIDMGDKQGGLSRSEQMALSICFGQALDNQANGQSNKYNDDLLTAGADHFLKTFSPERNPESVSNDQERKQLAMSMQSAMGGLFDAIKVNVTGSNLLSQFLGRIAGAEVAAIKATLDSVTNMSESSGRTKPEGSTRTMPDAVRPPGDSGSTPQAIHDASVKSSPAVSADSALQSSIKTGRPEAPDQVANVAVEASRREVVPRQVENIFVKAPAAAVTKAPADVSPIIAAPATASPVLDAAAADSAETVLKIAQQVALRAAAEMTRKDKHGLKSQASESESAESKAKELSGGKVAPTANVAPAVQTEDAGSAARRPEQIAVVRQADPVFEQSGLSNKPDVSSGKPASAVAEAVVYHNTQLSVEASAVHKSEGGDKQEIALLDEKASRRLLQLMSKTLSEVWSNPEALRVAYQSTGDRLYNSANKTSVRFEHKPDVINARAILPDGSADPHHRLSDSEIANWHLSTDTTVKISECQTLIELDSGRLYDPMTNRFFKKFGDTAMADGKPATEQDRNQIADLLRAEQMKNIMRNQLLARMSQSLQALQYSI